MADKEGERTPEEERALLDKWTEELAEHAAYTLIEAARISCSDKRWVAIAKTHFEQGFMALRRGTKNNHGRAL